MTFNPLEIRRLKSALKSAGKLHPAHSSLVNLKAATIKEVARLCFRKEL